MSSSTYSRLLLSADFYRRFSDYDYILIYQLDCLVFSENLNRWCDMGFDYIGAPWVGLGPDGSAYVSRVGNGGLSLRKVRSFLRVCGATGGIRFFIQATRAVLTSELHDLEAYDRSDRLRKKLSILKDLFHGPQSYIANYSLNEDRFWSDRAKLFMPWFSIAPVELAMRFSFEGNPRFCFERTGHELPFGCHGWYKHDRGFWEPHLLDSSEVTRCKGLAI
jgi:hypothetical protein